MNPQEPVRPKGALNVGIALVAYSVSIGALIGASFFANPWLIGLCVIVFMFSNSTIFSLLHESVHRTFSANPKINYLFGVLSAAFFPTGFTLQRGFHLGHHRRNRTDAEMFDLYYPKDVKFFKFLQWYSLFTGIYWLSVGFTAFMVMIWPGFFKISFFTTKKRIIAQTGGTEMFSSIYTEPEHWKMRGELLFTLLFQLSLFSILPLKFTHWLLCYWIFGSYWGAIQYADHAWTARDIRYGAWNLKVAKVVRLIHLNYHYHLVHHSYPWLPWTELEKYVDFTKPMPSFWSIYLQMWAGPRPTTEDSPKPLPEEFDAAL